MMHASGYGSTWHARLAPKTHRFKYRSAMLYLDLDHLDDFAGSTLRINRRGALSFRTRNIYAMTSIPVETRHELFVRSLLTIDVSSGETLTNPHCFGIGFNPLSVYFLHQADGSPGALIYMRFPIRLGTKLSVRDSLRPDCSGGEYWFDKIFHVSPFNPTTQRYVTKVQWPTDGHASIYLGLQDKGADHLMFEAGLTLDLTPYEGRSMKPLFLGLWPQTFLVVCELP